MKVNRAWLTESIIEQRFLSMAIAYKDALADGEDAEFKRALLEEMMALPPAVVQPWLGFIRVSLDKIKDDYTAMNNHGAVLIKDIMAAQRKLNESRSRGARAKQGKSSRKKR